MDDLKEKLLRRVVESANGCWLWAGGCDRDGYGKISVKCKTWSVHRLAWFVYRGEIPKGMNVNHTCDVRNCFNPEHLWVGTQFQNCLDKTLKGRSVRKLTREKSNRFSLKPGRHTRRGKSLGLTRHSF